MASLTYRVPITFLCFVSYFCGSSALGVTLQFKNLSSRNLKVSLNGEVLYLVFDPMVEIEVPEDVPSSFVIEEISDPDELRGVALMAYISAAEVVALNADTLFAAYSSLKRANLHRIDAKAFSYLYTELGRWELDYAKRYAQGLSLDRYKELKKILEGFKARFPYLKSRIESIEKRNGHYASIVDHVKDSAYGSASLNRMFLNVAKELSKVALMALLPVALDKLAKKRVYWKAKGVFNYENMGRLDGENVNPEASNIYRYVIKENMALEESYLAVQPSDAASVGGNVLLKNTTEYGIRLAYKVGNESFAIRLLPAVDSREGLVPTETSLKLSDLAEGFELSVFDPRDTLNRRAFETCSALCGLAVGGCGIVAALTTPPLVIGFGSLAMWGGSFAIHSWSCYTNASCLRDVVNATRIADFSYQINAETSSLVFKKSLSSRLVELEES